MIYKITPVAKCRMTRSDKWKQRPCVMKYWAFKRQVKKLGIKINPSGDHIIFYLPMPKTWSAKKKREMFLKPHQQKPDVDNILKGIQDSIFGQDCHIWDIRVSKLWDFEGRIEVKKI